MLATVSPVMVGAAAASPQPTTPLSDSTRTRMLPARETVSPAIFTSFFIGRLMAIGSMDLMRTIFPGRDGAIVPGRAAPPQAGLVAADLLGGYAIGLARVLRAGYCTGEWLRGRANIVGAEHALAHLDVVGDFGKLFPRMNERIAEHGAFHQPDAERQNDPAAQSRRHFGVHDDKTTAGAKLIPDVPKHGTVVRHDVEGQAEQHRVERFRRRVCGSVAFSQFDVVPAGAVTQFRRLAQHAARNIDAI